MDRRGKSIEMRTPAVLSAGLHVFALAAAVANFSFFNRPPLEPEPVMVDFVAIDKKAAAPTVGNPPPQPKEAVIDKETTKAPPPKTAEPPPAPEPPKPPDLAQTKPVPPTPTEHPKPEPAKPVEDKIAMKPKEPEPPKIEKPPEPPKPQPAPEPKKVETPKPAPPKPAPKPTVESAIDDILKNMNSKTKEKTPDQQPKPVEKITRTAPQAPNLAAVVTASEVEGVRQKIRPCWNFISGIKGAEDLVVTLVVQMNQDGTPVKADLKDTGRYNNDPAYRAAADAAHRAIMNPRCQPWPLSPEKYTSWRTITFNFDPRDY
jgi:hypothetical protein